ncbi:MAG: flavodoxin family protein, partial [Propionibacteriales bacterium]|nr:flavodoxin family protein [Propionibacteriales bacterium]
MSDAEPVETRYDDLNALFINCTLKRSPDPSHTQGLVDVSRRILEKQGVG